MYVDIGNRDRRSFAASEVILLKMKVNNEGNFCGLIKYKIESDDVLKKHLGNTSSRVSYIYNE